MTGTQGCLKVSECSIEEIASEIVATTSYFPYAWHIPFSAVMQLHLHLPMQHLDNARDNTQALQVNACLKEQIAKLPYMMFLLHDFTSFKAEKSEPTILQCSTAYWHRQLQAVQITAFSGDSVASASGEHNCETGFFAT